MRCLVTGATGYIGGRLVVRLLEEGHQVRCMTRSVGRLRDAPWADVVEVVEADAMDAASLEPAMAGCDVVYYLIHAIDTDDMEARDRTSATNIARAAEQAGVGRIVYLGGPVPEGELAPHLRSRAEVGDILLASSVPAAVLRAAVIIGSGSASFEMLRYLTERLPAMITPRWVRNHVQPIAVRDVLRYLAAAATLPAEVDRAFDIGGPEVITYEEMMQRYAKVAGLRRRLIVPVPVLSPSLSSHWVNLVTPVPGAIARPLIGSLIHEAVAEEHDIAQWIPDPPDGLIGVDRAIELALRKISTGDVETRWSFAAWPGAPSDPLPTDPDWSGGSVYVDERERHVDTAPARLWRVVEGIGGENGWYSFPLAWSLRGLADRLVGGVGLRRGRRDASSLRVGEALDFWRVEEVTPGTLLRLRAEMRLPGQAWLELRVVADTEVDTEIDTEIDTDGDGAGATLVQRAVFLPRGLAGHVYWWSVAPFHGVVFGSMIRNIARAAERLDDGSARSWDGAVASG